MRLLVALLAAVVAPTLLVGAAAGARSFSFIPVASGLSGAVGIASAPGDAATLYVAEQSGTVEMVRGGRVVGVFLDIRDRVGSGDERGLLSLAFNPAYAENHLVYVDYTNPAGDINVVEYRASGGVAVPSSARELLAVPHPWPNHNGGQLAFDRAGRLWVGLGDGGTDPAAGDVTLGDALNHAQDPGSKLGKLLRIDPTEAGASWQVAEVGLRNPWRFSFDRATGDLWIGDVGAARYEEIDYRKAAQLTAVSNFGWSRFEGKASYNPSIGLLAGTESVAPLWTYSHTDSAGASCAVIGGDVYRGARVPAARGLYFFGDYCSGSVWTLKRAKGRPVVTRLGRRLPSLSAFGESANGELYAVTTNGGLYVLR